jgi:glycosyltransferase involved in cell wall biosynthesis
MKVAIITCYFDPDYVRSLTLRAALKANPDVDLIIVKNRHKGLLRYPEVLLRILWTRLRKRPDVYLLTFRGQEVLPFLLVLAWPKPILFDEFIMPLAWAKQEKHDASLVIKFQKLIACSTAGLYKLWLKRSRFILTDTSANAQESSKLSGISLDKYKVLPVGAEEELFYPLPGSGKKTGVFEVFFCGNMRPLYGLEYVLEAALALKDQTDIHFYVVGGKQAAALKVAAAKAAGANVDYDAWVPFAQLPDVMRRCDIGLAGPYGLSPQAERVITGKTYQFLASAAPVIIGQNRETELFVDQHNCLLVPRGDAATLQQKILWAYENRDKLPEIGQSGRELYEEAYSVKVISRKLETILNDV